MPLPKIPTSGLPSPRGAPRFLDRLERKKFVTSWLGEPTSVQGGRRKRYYELTEDGGATLAELRRVREHLWRGRESLRSDKAG